MTPSTTVGVTPRPGGTALHPGSASAPNAVRTAMHPPTTPAATAKATCAAAPATPKRARAKRGDGDRLRDEILAATEQLLLAARDVDAVSVRAVAELVGCTAPAIYIHFLDKAELLQEVCVTRFEALAGAIDAATADVDDPVAALRAGTLAYVRFGLRHPAHYRVLFMEKPILHPDQWEALRAQGVTGFDALIARCQRAIDAHLLRIDDARLAALGIWTAAHGVVSLMISKPDYDWGDADAFIEHTVDTQLRGLAR